MVFTKRLVYKKCILLVCSFNQFYQVSTLLEQLDPSNRPDLTRQQIVYNRKSMKSCNDPFNQISDIDFQGLRLRGVDLSGLNMDSETFTKSCLVGVNLSNAQLSTASLNLVFFR